MPIAFAIPAILGAAGTLGSSLINRSGRSGSNNSVLLPPGLDTAALTSAIGDQRNLANFLTGEGRDTLTQGHDVLGQPLSFYQALLGGDRTKLTETLAPEIAAINAQFRAPLAEAQLTGRGSSLQPDIEAGRQSAISNLFFKERPIAADKLTGIAQGLMNLGTTQVGMGGNLFTDIAGEINSYNQTIRGLQAQTANQGSSGWSSLGASLGPLLTQILSPGSGGSSGGPTLPTINPAALEPGDIGGDPALPDFMGSFSPAMINSLTMSGYQQPEVDASWLDDIRSIMGGDAPNTERQTTRQRPWWQVQ